ncbi:hypothetical protein SD70_06515 [Gordoniibacillus kamchatkensis]|uniref:Uncharacterized protein n=1 Tax=Gordoniibacillus kamchatkensis TaxID=1590651 RepID=A0ABR5AKG1_9BACL|nr:hypothetical protein [Paenibacillus sp. VKM B-2647]KIL41522.1 hypothetical protein SD70_06515 [Paenibacillus sp. VKM B-2647]
MRIGAFVLGGLVGAAAVIYLSDKKNRSMMLNMFSSPADSLGKMFGKPAGKAADTVMNMLEFGTGMGKSRAGASTAGAASGAGGSANAQGTTGAAGRTGAAATGTAGANTAAASGQDSLAQVEKIVNADPELKRTVNEILTDSGKAGAQLQ